MTCLFNEKWPSIRVLRSYEKKNPDTLYLLWQKMGFSPNDSDDDSMAEYLKTFLSSSFPKLDLSDMSGRAWKSFRHEMAKLQPDRKWVRGRKGTKANEEDQQPSLFGLSGSPATIIAEGKSYDCFCRRIRVCDGYGIEISLQDGDRELTGLLF
jgi:hypothetical protein